MNSNREAVTAVVLCGGRGTRLGTQDKPLIELSGKPLVAHLLQRLTPQVDEIVLSCAARSLAAYQRFGYPIVTDREPDQGPLGGIASAAKTVATPWMLTIPGDTPFPAPDLVASLAPLCRSTGAAVATAGGRRQNLTMLLDHTHTESLCAFFAEGGRAAHHWLDANAVASVDFASKWFLNINTRADLVEARSRLAQFAVLRSTGRNH